MNPRTIGLPLLITIALLVVTATAYPYTGTRFGPWLYFAPYYFPPDGCCKGYCFSPNEFAPRYEDPPPLAPALFVPGGPPPVLKKQSAGSLGPPLQARTTGSREKDPNRSTGQNYRRPYLDPRPPR
jgi:hypothetical protein